MKCKNESIIKDTIIIVLFVIIIGLLIKHHFDKKYDMINQKIKFYQMLQLYNTQPHIIFQP